MKLIFGILGSITLVLGILGIFLPVLPTTPFLLLTAFFYVRSSERLYNWLMNHRHLGPYIKSFREERAIPLRVKIVSITLLWGTLLYCTFAVTQKLWLQCLFIAIATSVTWHILSYKTLKRD